jgi:hypothetical protein
MRAWVVKSRKTGISTWVQGVLIKRTTTMPNRTAVTIAQDSKTAGALFRIGYRMWANLPPAIRPALANRLLGAKNQMLHFGDRADALLGGLDSRLQVDTAKEIAAGRGETFTDMHLSECAWWDDGGKALSVITAVPDEPETLVVGRRPRTASTGSTSGGRRDRRRGAASSRCSSAGRRIRTAGGRSGRRSSARSSSRRSGRARGARRSRSSRRSTTRTPEQLHFRRTTIVDKAGGKLELFDQEFPVSWPRGVHRVGPPGLLDRVHRAGDEGGGVVVGAVAGGRRSAARHLPGRRAARAASAGRDDLVPTRALWVPESDAEGMEWWPGIGGRPATRVDALGEQERTAEEWRQAHAAGDVDAEAMERGQERALAGPRQYVIACDPADDVENQAPQEIEDHAFSAAVVVDHRTGEQVAEFEGRIDHDIVARHLFLAGLFFGEGWLSVEATGGYGNAMLKTLWQRFSYKRMFERQRTDSRKEERMRDRLGWDTNRRRSRRWSTARRSCCARGRTGSGRRGWRCSSRRT